MAMLAERKRRVKFCLNPRGNDWAKDANKFGQKLLEKMGWSPGKGLGASEQGMTDVLRVNYKNDTKGFGCKNKEEWLKQQDEFRNLLAKLSGAEGLKEQDLLQPIEKSQSLEKRSQETRTRLHYHKFTREKDLTRYSAKDLSCIVGVTPKVCDNEENTEGSGKFRLCGSIDDYFKNKSFPVDSTNFKELSSKTLKNVDIKSRSYSSFVSRGFQNSDGKVVNHEAIDTKIIGDDIRVSDKNLVNYNIKKRKKMRIYTLEQNSNEMADSGDLREEGKESRLKKRKKTFSSNNETDNENVEQITRYVINVENLVSPEYGTKKKKKKKKSDAIIESDNINLISELKHEENNPLRIDSLNISLSDNRKINKKQKHKKKVPENTDLFAENNAVADVEGTIENASSKGAEEKKINKNKKRKNVQIDYNK